MILKFNGGHLDCSRWPKINRVCPLGDMVRVQFVQSFFHYKSENENGIMIRYPFLYFSIEKRKWNNDLLSDF